MDITGIGSVAECAKSIIDRIWPPSLSPAERAKAELELQSMLQARENAVTAAQKEVIVAEMQQADNYTKRARPTIVYAGLAFIFLVHVFIPVIAFLKNTPVASFPTLTLPSEFWWTWGGVCGVWILGRSMEKNKAGGTLVSMITGSK